MTLDDLLHGARRFLGRAALAATIGLASLGAGYAADPVKAGPFSVDQTATAQSAPAPHKPRPHLHAAVAQPDYVVPIDDGTELALANLDTVAAEVKIYSGTTAVDQTTPQDITLNPGAFRWVTPGPGTVAYVGVTGANAHLLHVLAQRTHSVNGHVLTEQVPARSIDDMIPAGGTGWMPGPEHPSHVGRMSGTTQGVLFVSGATPTTVHLKYYGSGGCCGLEPTGVGTQPISYPLAPWSSIVLPDIYDSSVYNNWSTDPWLALNYLQARPESGGAAAFEILTDITSGQRSTLGAVQNRGDTDFAFIAQRRPGVLFTEPHLITTPADGTSEEVFWPVYEPRDSTALAILPNPSDWNQLFPLTHYAVDDVIAGKFGFFPGMTPSETYGFITGHGAAYAEGDWYADSTPEGLIGWNHLRNIVSYGDAGSWMAGLHPRDACGGAAAIPCSAIGITPATHIGLANIASNTATPVLSFYDATGRQLTTTQPRLSPGENTLLTGAAPDGAVRLVSRSAAGSTASYYLWTATPTAGDCVDYQAAKPFPGLPAS